MSSFAQADNHPVPLGTPCRRLDGCYCANSLNLSNLIANYLVNFMYLVTNSFDKLLNRIGNSVAFIER